MILSALIKKSFLLDFLTGFIWCISTFSILPHTLHGLFKDSIVLWVLLLILAIPPPYGGSISFIKFSSWNKGANSVWLIGFPHLGNCILSTFIGIPYFFTPFLLVINLFLDTNVSKHEYVNI